MDEKKLGLGNVVSISVGLVVATSCLVSLGEGSGTLGVTFILAMAIAMLLNMTTVASLSELNALMPNTTGGLAQYTLAALGPFPTLISMVGGYIICNTMSCGVEASIFSFSLADTLGLDIPSFVYTFIMTVVILLANLRGVDMFAKIQDIVAFLLVGSLVAMGFIGMIGMGTGVKVDQPYVLDADFGNIAAMTAVAFYRSRICYSYFKRGQECKEKCTTWNDDWSVFDFHYAVSYGSRFPQLCRVGCTCRLSSPASGIRICGTWKSRKNMDDVSRSVSCNQYTEFDSKFACRNLSGNGEDEYAS